MPLEGIATAEAGRVLVFADGQAFAFTLPGAGGRGSAGDALDGDVESPMPGRVISVDVAAGADVVRGQKLVTLEAMKMEHSLTAPFDGMVTELNVSEGAQVTEGTLLVRIERKGEEE
jgi:3-methylcrotonyl-CoA carboxylase alpha subunit